MASTRTLAALVVWTLVAGGCGGAGGSAEEELPPAAAGTGSAEWSNRDISCERTSDCAASEACVEGVCQMERCTDAPYDSEAPLGSQHAFFGDRELVAADATAHEGSYWVDGYHADGNVREGGAWSFGDSALVDLDGGDVFGDGTEHVVAALEGSQAVHVHRDGSVQALDVGFSPIAVAATDTDRDGTDEVAAFAGNGQFALCRPAEDACITRELQDDFKGDDVAAADVDGDGHGEIVFLVKLQGAQHVVVWNPHHETTGETPRLRYELGDSYRALGAGNLDGQGPAELAALKNADPVDLLADRVHVYAWGGEAFARAGGKKVGKKAIDVTVADLDRDRRAAVVVLRAGGGVEAYTADAGPGALSSAASGRLSASASPTRIAASDIDGDSPRARLVNGPELVSGPMVPVIAMSFPPYLEGVSDGTSIVAVGQTDKTSETYSDSVSLSVGVEFGVEAGINGIFASSLKSGIDREVEYTRGTTTQKAVGTRFSIAAKPDVADSYGVVLLSSGCFHAYTYELHDPSGYLDDGGQTGDGGRFFGMMPVGGEHTVWSTVRYNTLAAALGTLPIIEVGAVLGDPASYPPMPRRLDGSPVPAEDMVFPDPPQFAVSDIGKVGWRLTTSQSESQSKAMSHELSVSSSVNVAGLDVAGDVTAGTGHSYGLSVGRDVLFQGKVPPILDDPDTDADEYAENKFSFAPFVYRQAYTAPDGSESSYYVMDFTVGE